MSGLSSDHVCAFIWQRTDEHTRECLCSLAGVAHIAVIFEWFELETADRNGLRGEIFDLVEVNACRQRAEWVKQTERIKKGATA